MLVSNGIVVNAQPKIMEDGTTFDAEYYAQKYPDVVAVYGTEEKYTHSYDHVLSKYLIYAAGMRYLCQRKYTPTKST